MMPWFISTACVHGTVLLESPARAQLSQGLAQMGAQQSFQDAVWIVYMAAERASGLPSGLTLVTFGPLALPSSTTPSAPKLP